MKVIHEYLSLADPNLVEAGNLRNKKKKKKKEKNKSKKLQHNQLRHLNLRNLMVN